MTTAGAYTDGRWHHVVATLSGKGMALYLDALYLDGELAGRVAGATFAQAYSGYWRIGGDSSWAGAAYFAGRIDEVAVYPNAISADLVARNFALGSTGSAPNLAPSAASPPRSPV